MKSFSTYRLIVCVVIIITIAFLLPVFINGFSFNGISKLLFNSSNGFSSSLTRTVLFALISSVINVAGGFCLALILSKISLHSRIGRQLSFFILPLTFGNVATVFVYKVLLFDTTFFNSIVQGGSFTQTLFLLFIQFWQFGFLFAYLFWLNIQNTPKRLNDYALVARLSPVEKTRDIILPQVRNLFILLLFIGFIFSFYEDAKSQFIFKASQGMGTELINHWLHRTYQSNLLINPVYANQSIFTTGLLVFVFTLLVFLILGMLTLIAFRYFSKIKSANQSNLSKPVKTDKNKIAVFIAIIGIAIILLPVITSLLKSQYNLADNLSTIGFPFILTFIAAFAATLFAVTFGISSRLAFPKLLNGFHTKSLLYFLAIFFLQIIPPLCIVLCGFKWLSWIGYSSDILIYCVWIAGHCILKLPILGSFALATHFSVKGNELNYLTAYNISGKSIIEYSFLKRFRAEYILTFLFAFTFIWNDAGLNMVLSDKIPSFAANLQMLFIGRAADYSKATSFVLIAVVLSLSCILIWNYIIRKTEKLNET